MGIEPSKFEQFFVPWPCLVAGEGYPKDGTAWDGSNAWHVWMGEFTNWPWCSLKLPGVFPGVFPGLWFSEIWCDMCLHRLVCGGIMWCRLIYDSSRTSIQ
jgi:hypothetical protein